MVSNAQRQTGMLPGKTKSNVQDTEIPMWNSVTESIYSVKIQAVFTLIQPVPDGPETQGSLATVLAAGGCPQNTCESRPCGRKDLCVELYTNRFIIDHSGHILEPDRNAARSEWGLRRAALRV